MLFTQVGRFIAALSVILGILGLGIGFEMSMNYEELTKDAVKLANMLFEKGFICFLFGVILGVLTDISYSLLNNKLPS